MMQWITAANIATNQVCDNIIDMRRRVKFSTKEQNKNNMKRAAIEMGILLAIAYAAWVGFATLMLNLDTVRDAVVQTLASVLG